MKKDVEGREIEPGDLLLRAINSTLAKQYALFYTKKGTLALSCRRDEKNKCIYSGAHHTGHNSKQYPVYGWGDLYILEKQCTDMPDEVKRLIKR